MTTDAVRRMRQIQEAFDRSQDSADRKTPEQIIIRLGLLREAMILTEFGGIDPWAES